ncbi:MAG: WXG100 family type VII secretion target, partial [Actinomycetota bacterium]|nr:WXG100 family type VII secretion target [Actinomycetota bacterium]
MSFWMTPQRIYEELTTGPGSETLQTAQHISREESAAEQARAQRIRRLMTTIESGWQGSAAEGAQGAARPLAQHADEGAEYLYLAQDLLDRQAGSFHRAAASVEPMPSDPAAAILEEAVPFEVDTDFHTQEYQQKAQHNIRVFEGYDNASNHNETYLPQQFSSVNHSGGGISVTPADTIEVDDSPRRTDPGDTARYQGPVDGTAPSGYRAPGSYPSSAGPVPGVTVPAGGATGRDGWGGTSGGNQATGPGPVFGPDGRGTFGPGGPGGSRGPGWAGGQG